VETITVTSWVSTKTTERESRVAEMGSKMGRSTRAESRRMSATTGPWARSTDKKKRTT
jgi:hypothetical protein